MKTLALVALLTLAGCSSAAIAAPKETPTWTPTPSFAQPSTTSEPNSIALRPVASASPSALPHSKSTPVPTKVRSSSSTSQPKVAPKPLPKPTPKPTVKPTPKPATEPATEPDPPVFDVFTSCTSIIVDAGVPAWILIYAAPTGVIEPTAEQEHIIDAMAPTGVQSIELPGDGPYDYGVSITYFDTVEDATGTTECPA